MICCDRFFIFLPLATLAQNRTIPCFAPSHLPLYERSVCFTFELYPLKSTTTLASLVKGEVLSPEKIRATTGGIVTPTFRSAPTFQKPHFPSKSTISLPPLSKGGGLTARHKLLPCCFLLAICPLFLYCKLFSRQDGGIASVASTLSIPTTIAKR